MVTMLTLLCLSIGYREVTILVTFAAIGLYRLHDVLTKDVYDSRMYRTVYLIM